jgi:hypothetical protein
METTSIKTEARLPRTYESTKLSMRQSANKQLQELHTLRTTDPAALLRIHTLGEEFIDYAHHGKYMKFLELLNGTDSSEIYTYYIVKAFRASLVGAHLMLTGLMIDHGYPFNSNNVPVVLFEVLSLASNSNIMNDDKAVTILEFLIMKGYDVNLTSKDNYMTALHVCITYGLIKCCSLLIDKGADVNAVGHNDVMPLPLSYKLLKHITSKTIKKSSTIISKKENNTEPIEEKVKIDSFIDMETFPYNKDDVLELVKVLIRRGAKMSWRRDHTEAHLSQQQGGLMSGPGWRVVEDYSKQRNQTETSNIFSTSTSNSNGDDNGKVAPVVAQTVSKNDFKGNISSVADGKEESVSSKSSTSTRGTTSEPKMVSFSGTVSAATTPTLQETLLAIHASDGKGDMAEPKVVDVEGYYASLRANNRNAMPLPVTSTTIHNGTDMNTIFHAGMAGHVNSNINSNDKGKISTSAGTGAGASKNRSRSRFIVEELPMEDPDTATHNEITTDKDTALKAEGTYYNKTEDAQLFSTSGAL